MANTIITKNSSTASAVPAAGSLTQGELAVNVTDKKLYTKDSGGSVVEITPSVALYANSAGTAANGGVTSVNGQTGAVTVSSTPPTAFDEIGTYTWGIATSLGFYNNYPPGTTVSGSSIVIRLQDMGGWDPSLVANTTISLGTGASSLSNGCTGTWRLMCYVGHTYYNSLNSQKFPALWVRIS